MWTSVSDPAAPGPVRVYFGPLLCGLRPPNFFLERKIPRGNRVNLRFPRGILGFSELALELLGLDEGRGPTAQADYFAATVARVGVVQV